MCRQWRWGWKRHRIKSVKKTIPDTRNEKRPFPFYFLRLLLWVLSVRKHILDIQPLPIAIAVHASKSGTSAMVPMSMSMSVIVSMGPFPILFPTIPIIFEVHSRVISLTLRTIVARSQRCQLQARPNIRARSRTAGGGSAVGAHRFRNSRRWCRGRGSGRWGD